MCWLEGGTMSSSSWIWVRMSPMVAGGYVEFVKLLAVKKSLGIRVSKLRVWRA